MKRYSQEEIRQSVQTIADAYLSMYETIRDPKTVTVADDTVIQKLQNMGFPQQGRPLDNVVGEMLEDGELRRQLPGAGNHSVAVPAGRLPPNGGRTVCLRRFHRQPDSTGGCPPCHVNGNRIKQRCGLPFGTDAFFHHKSTADHGADQRTNPHDSL